jgi:hypothetical protein
MVLERERLPGGEGKFAKILSNGEIFLRKQIFSEVCDDFEFLLQMEK